jgi:XRE family transcriptional regulator, regulator of sulfur utilization
MTSMVSPSMFASAVRARRSEKQISLRQLARRSDCSPSALSQVERGEAVPRLTLAWRIAKALEVELPDLLREEEAPMGDAVNRGGIPC